MKHLTGIESHYIIKNNKKLRFGYTTGTCAAAASKAAAMMLLLDEPMDCVELKTPRGIELNLEIVDTIRTGDSVSCAIVKDGGDDPDVTHGLKIYAKVERIAEGFIIDGGEGVGRVTRGGLEQPVGAAAINSTPRRMIGEALKEAAENAAYQGGLKAVISVPGGEKTAEKTFNPILGIQGGISILGTSGIVEPMSETALIRSLELEMKQQAASGRKYLVVTLGNYGKNYLAELEDVPVKDSVKCSNYIGEVIDIAVNLGVKGLLFIAHIGKFAKVAGGIMNTHSRNADARAEILAAAALRAGISREGALRILETPTTDAALDILAEENIMKQTMDVLMEKIAFYLNHRCYGAIETEALVFSNDRGYLGETDGFRKMVEKIKGELHEG
ncbi:MAG: cobalt-precorrin-5B (C(1))-methyltransferase CbiD [Firmicutes bacterium]|nr:cobalt-precorrin-5B (C(1))-methyltransferase CbiD [Bacillota bacterium]MDD7603046.1 cobalt-precorrin-5B (C(1))-methyltransferase CbiD [Bacillota bacterium]MDY5856358.1 cobalt-precorrin-5B (C(1))-methyltransferase CbiD [Anaerovoracaceae bacterium]